RGVLRERGRIAEPKLEHGESRLVEYQVMPKGREHGGIDPLHDARGSFERGFQWCESALYVLRTVDLTLDQEKALLGRQVAHQAATQMCSDDVSKNLLRLGRSLEAQLNGLETP